jgi:hypothetical protein
MKYMRLTFVFFVLTSTLACNESKPVSQIESKDTLSIISTPVIEREILKDVDNGRELYLNFNEIEVVFDSLKLWDYEKDDLRKLQNINGDSVTVAIDLGDDLQQQTFALKYSEMFNDIKVEQSYITSMSIQGEGPHLDLTDWKHYQSGWKPVSKISNNKYRCLSYTESEQTRFPEVTLEDVKLEIAETENYKEWLSYLDNKYPFGSVIRATAPN